jgi:hypothetical protein
MDYSAEGAEHDPDGISVDARDHAPLNIRSGTMGLIRYAKALRDRGEDGPPPLFKYQLLGVLLCPNPDGTLADPAAWLLRRLPVPTDATTSDIVSGRYTLTATSSVFSLLEGRLSRSFLAPVAEALAAVVAWGTWTPPGSSPLTAAGSEFRKVSRTSAYKRAERRGDVAGVQVLDARAHRTSVTHTTEGEGRTVRTHYGRGHWRRVRVGPRDDWSYLRKHVRPVIVNPGQDPIEDLVRIYRLPPPPEN